MAAEAQAQAQAQACGRLSPPAGVLIEHAAGAVIAAIAFESLAGSREPPDPYYDVAAAACRNRLVAQVTVSVSLGLPRSIVFSMSGRAAWSALQSSGRRLAEATIVREDHVR